MDERLGNNIMTNLEITEEEKQRLDYEEMTKKAYATTMISIEGMVKNNTELIADFISQTKDELKTFKEEIVSIKLKDVENSIIISEEIKSVNLSIINFSSKMETMQLQMNEFKLNSCSSEDKPIREKIFSNFRNKMKIFGGLQDAGIKQTGSMIPIIIIFTVLFLLFNIGKIADVIKLLWKIP
jgi:hypothetical protein